MEYVDNGFGPVVVEPIRDLFERRDTITLKAQDAANRWALRRWLWSLRGRQASFWLPTWGNELQLRAPMSAGATLMRVAPIGPVAQLIGRRIALEVGDALRFRTITAAIEDGLEHRLSLSSSPGTPMPLGTKVHLMTLVRADTDRVEISHGVGASEVSLPIVEVST